MAEHQEKEIREPLVKDGWQIGSADGKVGENRRDEPNAVVTPYGWYSFNVEASAMCDRMASARGMEGKVYNLRYLFHKGQGKVGFVATDQTGTGISAIRRYENNGSSRITLFQPGPFKEDPDLRPAGKRKCTVAMETNPFDGLPMVTVAVKTGLPTLTRSRKKKGDAAGEVAAGQNPAEGQEPG